MRLLLWLLLLLLIIMLLLLLILLFLLMLLLLLELFGLRHQRHQLIHTHRITQQQQLLLQHFSAHHNFGWPRTSRERSADEGSIGGRCKAVQQ